MNRPKTKYLRRNLHLVPKVRMYTLIALRKDYFTFVFSFVNDKRVSLLAERKWFPKLSQKILLTSTNSTISRSYLATINTIPSVNRAVFDTLHCIELEIIPLLPWLSNNEYLYNSCLELTARLGTSLLKTRYQKQEVKTKTTETGVTERTTHYHFAKLSVQCKLRNFL